MSTRIYIEGGGSGPDSKALQSRCREGFSNLLEKCGFRNRMPRLIPCGSRNSAWDAFKTDLTIKAPQDFVALWIDSEDPMDDIEKSWEHLKKRDNWCKPAGVEDEQVLFMTTCMETWIIADREALKEHYGNKLQTTGLPPLVNLEKRDRHNIQDMLVNATRKCSNAYAKGKRSFVILANMSPATLMRHLPSFARVHRILMAKL